MGLSHVAGLMVDLRGAFVGTQDVSRRTVLKGGALRTTFVALGTLLAVGTVSTQVAVADPPTREPNPLPTGVPFPFTDAAENDPCGFVVLMEVTTNKETVTTFTRRSGVKTVHITGAKGNIDECEHK